jgi:hypothetical protein
LRGKDPFKGFERNLAVFNAICPQYRGSFEFVAVNGAGHFPTMDASRQQWLAWIEDRFEEREVSKDCARSELKGLLPAERYQAQRTSYFQWSGKSEEFYQLPAA